MKNKLKIFLIMVAVILCVSFSLAACSGKFDGSIIVKDESKTVEVNSLYQIPEASLKGANGDILEEMVEIKAYNPNNIIIATKALEFKCKALGEYKIEYSYKNLKKVIIITAVDSTGPQIVATNIFKNTKKGENVLLPSCKVEDFSGVKTNGVSLKVFYDNNGTLEAQDIDESGSEFFAAYAGKHILRIEATDKMGNISVKDLPFYVTDSSWMAQSLPDGAIATYSEKEYANTFETGTVTDMQGNSEVIVHTSYKGASGVAQVNMGYFDHAFGAYASVNVRLPMQYTYGVAKKIAIRLRTEKITMSSDIMLFKYNYAHDVGIGQLRTGTYKVQAGEWTTIILDSSILSQLKNSNDIVEGFQFAVKLAKESTEDLQELYFDSITEITTLTLPTGVAFATDTYKLSWNSVANASGYVVSVNGKDLDATDKTEIVLPKDKAYILKVKAVGDEIFYSQSGYSGQVGNVLGAPIISLNQSNVLSWAAVENASSYMVEVNGTKHAVEGLTKQLDLSTDKNHLIKVWAVGDNTSYFDSVNTSRVIRNVPQQNGYVADFADEMYTYDVEKVTAINLAPLGGETLYTAEYLDTYEGASGVLKVEMTVLSSTWALVALKLPNTLMLDSTLQSLGLRFRIEGFAGGGYDGLRVYGLGSDGAARDISPAETFASNGINSWYSATIGREKIDTGFNNSESSDYILFGVGGVAEGTTFTVYLDEITCVRFVKLSTPTNLTITGNTLSWDAVQNASSYVVSINGTETTVTTNSKQFDVSSEVYIITVKALGAEGYLSSDTSQALSNKLATATNFKYQGGLLSWDAVANAQKYQLVFDENAPIEVSTNSYAFVPANNVNYTIKVKALTSAAFIPADYTMLEIGGVSNFSEDASASIEKVTAINLAPLGGETLYTAEYLNTYEGASGVLKVEMTVLSSTWALVALKLPNTLMLDSTLQSLGLRFRIEGFAGGGYDGLRVYGLGSDGAARDISPAETFASSGINSWYSATIGREKIDTGFNNSESSDYILFGVGGVAEGTTFTVYLDEITWVRTA